MEKRYAKSYLQELNYKWKSGNLTPEEQRYLDKWEENLDDDILSLPEDYKDNPNIIRDRITQNVLTRIKEGETRHSASLWLRIAVAASIVFITSMGLWFNRSLMLNLFKGHTPDFYVNDIVPGKVGATLTLADGRKLKLVGIANGEIVKEAGISVIKTADGQLVYQIKEDLGETNKINTLSTAKGETYMLILPDKSKVWLNAASSLTYSAALNKRGMRSVKLEGEAYFEIFKDKEHPFIVESRGQKVQVLGTHFNINSYADELSVKTTLLEGSVRVNNSTVLKPGQQSLLTENGMKVQEVKAEDAVAWKDGIFLFEDESLQEIMCKVARWYDVEIEYQNVDRNKRYYGGVSRSDNVSKVLRKLELTGGVHFKIEGRKVIVMK